MNGSHPSLVLRTVIIIIIIIIIIADAEPAVTVALLFRNCRTGLVSQIHWPSIRLLCSRPLGGAAMMRV